MMQAKSNKKFNRLRIVNFPKGMTLIELLVVISIMVMLVSISIPVFKPLLESQRTANASRVLAMALQRARVRAMQEQRSYGVEIVRYTDYDNPNMGLLLKLQKDAPNLVQFSGSEKVRVRVENGQIKICVCDTSSSPPMWRTKDNPGSVSAEITSAENEWNQKVKAGYYVQFVRLGRLYKIDEGDNSKLADPYHRYNFPPANNIPTNSATEFTIFQMPKSALTAPVMMPRGTAIDLQYSSFRNPGNTGSSESFGFNSFSSFSKQALNVTVMFSPSGHVESFYYSDAANNLWQVPPHGGLFYFLVGEWDRQSTNSTGDTLAEDGRNNLITPSNFWVTVHPQTGQVRIAENATIPKAKIQAWQVAPQNMKELMLYNMYEDARKFATEHYVNVGGF